MHCEFQARNNQTKDINCKDVVSFMLHIKPNKYLFIHTWICVSQLWAVIAVDMDHTPKSARHFHSFVDVVISSVHSNICCEKMHFLLPLRWGANDQCRYSYFVERKLRKPIQGLGRGRWGDDYSMSSSSGSKCNALKCTKHPRSRGECVNWGFYKRITCSEAKNFWGRFLEI